MPPKNRVGLTVNGREYGGWKTVAIARSIKTLSGAFELDVSDRWSKADPWPIREEDSCELRVDDEVVITGAVDEAPTDEDADSHSLSVTGRDTTGALVDCSVAIGAWEFKGITLEQFAKKLCAPFSIPVAMQSGLSLVTPPKYSIEPGETPFDALQRACVKAGVLPIADGVGGLLLMRPGVERCDTALVFGQNVKRVRVRRSAIERFARYEVHAQRPGDDDSYAKTVVAVVGTARDANVKRTARVLVIRADGAMTKAQAIARAQWEATVRAARSVSVEVTVQGWKQKSGTVWPINAQVPVKIPRHGIDGPMLISSVRLTQDADSGSLAELSLERPGAYRPEPVVTTKSERMYFT